MNPPNIREVNRIKNIVKYRYEYNISGNNIGWINLDVWSKEKEKMFLEVNRIYYYKICDDFKRED